MPITTLLFDLDDTLLGNQMERFLPAYLNKLAVHMADLVPPHTLVDELIGGTQAMLLNTDPARTLEQAFAEYFYPAIHVPPAQFKPRADSFYAERFGELRAQTTVRPEAREVMQWAAASGLRVAIATNAVFPRTAVAQRLEWAGVSADEFSYSLVTTYEFMHFAKPRAEYFAEILAWLDCRPNEVLMVGNDWEQDIVPAAEMGIHTFWIRAADSRAPGNTAHPIGSGRLTDFLAWARAADSGLTSLAPLPLTPRAVRAHQAAALAVILEVTRGLPDSQCSLRPGSDPAQWSVTEVACHLRDVEVEVNLPRLSRALEESNPFISAVDSDSWAAARQYHKQSGRGALADFAAARKQTLAILDRLTPPQWQLATRHAIFGPTTLQELVNLTVEHDRLHLRQIRENLQKTSVAG